MLDPTATLILDWLQQIGLTVRLVPLGADTFLPGVTLEPGGLIVDPERLLYPGDLLHEAGHLATMLPAHRGSTGSNAGSDMGDEIAAQTGPMPPPSTSDIHQRSSFTPPATGAPPRPSSRPTAMVAPVSPCCNGWASPWTTRAAAISIAPL